MILTKKEYSMLGLIFLIISCSVSKPVIAPVTGVQVVKRDTPKVTMDSLKNIPETDLSDDEKFIRDQLLGISSGMTRLSTKMDGVTEGNRQILDIGQSTHDLNLQLFERSRELRTSNNSLQSRLNAMRDFAIKERRERLEWQQHADENMLYGRNMKESIRFYATVAIVGWLLCILLLWGYNLYLRNKYRHAK